MHWRLWARAIQLSRIWRNLASDWPNHLCEILDGFTSASNSVPPVPTIACRCQCILCQVMRKLPKAINQEYGSTRQTYIQQCQNQYSWSRGRLSSHLNHSHRHGFFAFAGLSPAGYALHMVRKKELRHLLMEVNSDVAVPAALSFETGNQKTR